MGKDPENGQKGLLSKEINCMSGIIVFLKGFSNNVVANTNQMYFLDDDQMLN